MRLIGDVSVKRVIDVGCGTGYLTAEISRRASFVLGLDQSKGMIDIANREYGHLPQLKFINESIEDFSNSQQVSSFDVAIANMSLITMPNLNKALKAVSSILVTKGIFVANITHPCFYNQHRHYEPDESFQYIISHPQKGKFIISNDAKGLSSPTTHFHRPLQEYFKSLREASFVVDQLVEPFPNPRIMKLYLTPWEAPRFLSLKCVKMQI